jgi:cytochrome c-type biogenesis protein CcmE
MAKKSKVRWIVGGAVIAGAIVAISFLNLGDNLIYFYTPSEAIAKAADLSDQTVKVGGMVLPGSVKWHAEDLDLKFTIGDMKGNDIAVSHRGTPPDMFKEGQGVVVEGRITDGGKAMISRNLLVKHSEEYKKPDDHTKMDHMLLEQSIIKNEKTDKPSE